MFYLMHRKIERKRNVNARVISARAKPLRSELSLLLSSSLPLSSPRNGSPHPALQSSGRRREPY